MKTFMNYGQGLSVDYDRLLSYGDRTAFHMHPHYELYILPEPLKTESIICGSRIITDYPCAILTAPYIPHFTNTTEYSGKYHRLVFYFGSEVTSAMQLPFSMEQLLGNSACHIFNLSEKYPLLIYLIQICNLTSDLLNRQKILEIFLNLLYQCRDTTEKIKKSESYIWEVIDYILQHLDTACNIKEIAEHFFVSYNKLRHDFENYTSISLGDFILTVKLNRAKELLKRTKLSVAQIAKECGWESESYFYKFFRNRTNKTPLAYRKNHIIT